MKIEELESVPDQDADRRADYVDYIARRKKLHGPFFETALPNEYLVEIGRRKVSLQLGGRRFRLFKKFMQSPRDQVASRVTTSINQQHEEKLKVDEIEPFSINFGVNDLAGQIFARVRFLLFVDLLGVGKHLHAGLELRTWFERFGSGVQNFGQGVELATVVERNTHQVGNDI